MKLRCWHRCDPETKAVFRESWGPIIIGCIGTLAVAKQLLNMLNRAVQQGVS